MQEPNQAWDKKKIIISILIFLVVAAVGYTIRTYLQEKKVSALTKDVKGASIRSPYYVPSVGSTMKKSFSQKVHQVEQEVENLNLVAQASKSAQVKKLLNDLKSLQSYPANQAKTACEQICTSL